MSEDSVKKLFDKIDYLSERLTRVETILTEREKSQKSYIGTIAWCITTAISVIAIIINHWR